MNRLGAYKPEPEPELEPKPEPKPKPELEPKLSHTHSRDSFYHPELRVYDYFSGSSGYGYHFGFDIFSLVPPQYSTPPKIYT
ncbi:hypothetical protein PVK06_004915 [Gossypium arboreum]|uniref:Uncharacterized protein n=1 Tax=Gossypium arboreum TaxID=29729 RepID=A0ABR0QUH3_GOSAR|nr:hypothetical protein PVK06_004915 [Gossypium arboreum]